MRSHWSIAHDRQVRAPVAATWRSASTVTLADLTVGRALVLVRYALRPGIARDRPLLLDGPLRPLLVVDGERSVSGLVSRPWRLHPERHPVSDLAELHGFAEPGWVRLSTRTTVTATDGAAARRFTAYWLLARPFVGLLRRDILRAIAVRAEAGR